MNGPLAVVLQGRATREVDEIDAWWRENRRGATLGAPARSKRLRDVRRVLLKKTRYHVYYRVHGDVLEVLAVWHAARGKGPGL